MYMTELTTVNLETSTCVVTQRLVRKRGFLSLYLVLANDGGCTLHVNDKSLAYFTNHLSIFRICMHDSWSENGFWPL